MDLLLFYYYFFLLFEEVILYKASTAARRRTTLLLATDPRETNSSARAKTSHATKSCKEKGDYPGYGHAGLGQEEEVAGRRELDKEL